jgi:hypothetical protein
MHLNEPRYGKRLVLMLVLALPVSVALMTTIWPLFDPAPATVPWIDRVLAVAIFLSVAGTVAGVLLSALHTWLIRREIVNTRLQRVLAAAIIGSCLGGLIGLSWSAAAGLALAGWGASLGLLYWGIASFALKDERR